MPPPLQEVIRQLGKYYGRPKPPIVTDPFEMILWENVAYLLDDARRAQAFDALRRNAGGVKPKHIAAAPQRALIEATRLGGMFPEKRADRIRLSAEMTISQFQGDLRRALQLPLPAARKALKQYPTIGDPGAEKILLFTGTAPILALESNGLRVVTRLGYSEERKNYSATYRGAQQALAAQTGNDCAWITEAHQLLRQHGQELCRRTQPACHVCPLAAGCDYGRLATGESQ
jgi:endonuclease-3